MKGSFTMNRHECHIGIGIVLRNLLAWFKTDLIDLEVFSIDQISKTTIFFLENFFFL